MPKYPSSSTINFHLRVSRVAIEKKNKKLHRSLQRNQARKILTSSEMGARVSSLSIFFFIIFHPTAMAEFQHLPNDSMYPSTHNESWEFLAET